MTNSCKFRISHGKTEKRWEKLLPKPQSPFVIPGYTPAWGVRQAHWQFARSNILRAQSQTGCFSHAQNQWSIPIWRTTATNISRNHSVSNVQQRCPALFERMVTFLDSRWANQTFANVLETSDSPKPHMPTNANSLTVNIQLEWYSPYL